MFRFLERQERENTSSYVWFLDETPIRTTHKKVCECLCLSPGCLSRSRIHNFLHHLMYLLQEPINPYGKAKKMAEDIPRDIRRCSTICRKGEIFMFSVCLVYQRMELQNVNKEIERKLFQTLTFQIELSLECNISHFLKSKLSSLFGFII